MTTVAPGLQCMLCKHFRDATTFNEDDGTSPVDTRLVCAAFPDGIPDEITADEFDHRQPHPDDNGIQWEAIDAEAQAQRDSLPPLPVTGGGS